MEEKENNSLTESWLHQDQEKLKKVCILQRKKQKTTKLAGLYKVSISQQSYIYRNGAQENNIIGDSCMKDNEGKFCFFKIIWRKEVGGNTKTTYLTLNSHFQNEKLPCCEEKWSCCHANEY